MATEADTINTRPTTLIHLYRKPYEALIDTGAVVSIIPKHVYDNLPNLAKQTISTSPLPTLSGVTGNQLTTYGSIHLEIPFPSLRRSFRHKFIIAKARNMILGSDFLATHNLVIDCKKSTLSDIETEFIASIDTESNLRLTTRALLNSLPQIIRLSLEIENVVKA